MALLPKEKLHEKLIAAIGTDVVLSASTDSAGELEVELLPPLPGRVRIYVYNATNPPGGRPTPEHKIQLILRGQRRGERADFNESGVDLVLLCGYVGEHDIFVLWDASLHRNFSHSKNLQVKTENVIAAAAGTRVRQERRLATGSEIVICAPPSQLMRAILERSAGSGVEPQDTATSASHGQPYVRPSRRGDTPPKTRVFRVDPDDIDRGTDAHKDIQDQLADAVSSRGWEPRSPVGPDPRFDIAWIAAQAAWITEVKSLTTLNEERQLRLGLGQVLSYAYLVNWDVTSKHAVLAVEREPSSSYWPDLCESHGVRLAWPDVFDDLLDSCA